MRAPGAPGSSSARRSSVKNGSCTTARAVLVAHPAPRTQPLSREAESAERASSLILGVHDMPGGLVRLGEEARVSALLPPPEDATTVLGAHSAPPAEPPTQPACGSRFAARTQGDFEGLHEGVQGADAAVGALRASQEGLQGATRMEGHPPHSEGTGAMHGLRLRLDACMFDFKFFDVQSPVVAA